MDGIRSVLVVVAVLFAAVVVWWSLRDHHPDYVADGYRVVITEPDAVWRCDRVGYPCAWDAADPAVLAATQDALIDAASIAGKTDEGLAVALDRAVEHLWGRPEVVEVSADLDGLTGLMFRLEGGLPVYVETLASAPLRDDRGALAPPDADAASVSGTVVRDTVQAAAYRPTQQPGQSERRALVLEPYSSFEPWRQEGLDVAAALRGHEDFEFGVDYVADDVGLDELTGWGAYDVVHVSTHGMAWCDRVAEVVGMAGSSPVVTGDTVWDLDRCYAGFGAGRLDDLGLSPEGKGFAPLRTHGLSYLRSSVDGQDRLFVSDAFFRDQPGLDRTIVFLSTCKSAGIRNRGVANPFESVFGTFLGWDHSVVMSSAARTAVAFWDLMAVNGLRTDLAYERLEELGLDRSVVRGGADISDLDAALRDIFEFGPPRAELVLDGIDRRARDVVTSFASGDVIQDGSRLSVVGTAGDGQADRIRDLRLDVEGVRAGTADSVTLEILVDDQTQSQQISLARDGRLVEEGAGWEEWTVELPEYPLDFDVAPLSASGVAPEHAWEVRVHEQRDHYSAHVADPVQLLSDQRLCDVVEPLAGPLSSVFGTGAPLTETGSAFGDGHCQFNYDWPGPCCPEGRSTLHMERLPAIIGDDIDEAASGFDGAPTPAPTAGDDAVSIVVDEQVHVLFSVGGRVYDVWGFYDPSEGKVTTSSMVAAARIVRDALTGDAEPPRDPPPTTNPGA